MVLDEQLEKFNVLQKKSNYLKECLWRKGSQFRVAVKVKTAGRP